MSVVHWAWLVACLSVVSSGNHSRMLYEMIVIPDDKTVTVVLSQPGQVVNRFYVLQKDVQTLSITVTPCGVPVAWGLDYRNTNQTGKVDVEGGSEGVGLVGLAEQRHRLISPASNGLYTVCLSSTQVALVEVFATIMGPPSQLWPTGRIVARSRPAKGTVFLRWPRKTVDPDKTEYVLVVHRSPAAFHSLCQARELHLRPNNHIIMEKTRQRTSWLVRGLVPEQAYRAEVFAVHTSTNFSYKYAELPRLLYSRQKPRPLTDRVQVSAELQPHEPTKLFRYKVRQENLDRLEFGVTACGEGSLNAEVKVRGGGVLDHRLVKGYAVLSVAKPPLGSVYVLKLRLPPTSGPVSVQVTAQGEEPLLPDPAEIHEFRGLRSCREVTLGWVPVSGTATYCLRASQSRRGDILRREPDQCLVEQQLNSLGYSVLQCSKIDSQDRKVISERLTNLKPGKKYDIQVSVKKGNSKRLSYKLVRVRTKSRCS